MIYEQMVAEFGDPLDGWVDRMRFALQGSDPVDLTEVIPRQPVVIDPEATDYIPAYTGETMIDLMTRK